MRQKDKPDTHTEAALYWSAVSLMVCEGLPIEQAARKLGVECELLRMVLERRGAPFDDCPTFTPATPSRRDPLPLHEFS